MNYCYRCMRDTGADRVCPVCGFPKRSQRDVGDDSLLPLGTRLDNGNIVIGEKLGRGGFGITYVAREAKLGLIAIKEFYPYHMVNSMRINNAIYINDEKRDQYLAFMRSFEREAETLSKLEHENIVRVLFEFEENNTCYYGMDLLKGVTLFEWITQKGPVTAEEAFELIKPILDALDYVHSKNVLHRDISPGNIFMRTAPSAFMGVSPCLIDFGAAYDAKVNYSRSAPHIKSKGYSPPEQNAGHEFYGPFSDIYAISAVLYFMVTGKKPIPAEDRLTGRIPFPEPVELMQTIPKAFSDAIMRGMMVDSRQRTQNVQTLRRELENSLRPQNTPNRLFKEEHKSLSLSYGPSRNVSDDRRGRSYSIDSLRCFLGSVIDALLFAVLWTLIMAIDATNRLVDDNLWIGGLAAFIVAVMCNVVTCVTVGSTLGECLAQAPRRNLDSGKAALYALMSSVYPLTLVAKLAQFLVSGSEPQEGKVIIDGLEESGGVTTGVTGPRLTALNPADRRLCMQELRLDRNGMVLGRKIRDGQMCDAAVTDSSSVSRRHCRIGFDNSWYIEDTNSKNGTFVNGTRINTETRMTLRDGVKISMGNEGIEFIFHEQ